MNTNNVIKIVVGTAVILSIPLIAMQFSNEVDWDLFDFLVIGTLLIGTGLIYELITSKVTSTIHKVIIAIGLALMVATIWADLAVGIFNIPGFSGS